MRRIWSVLSCGLVLAVLGSHANADVIRSPTAVIQNTLGEFSGVTVVGKTIDQSGLLAGFTSGVTDFDAYLAGTPLHDFNFTIGEWFSLLNVTTGVIDYDLGGVFNITRMAMWNEDFGGITQMDVFTSNDAGFGVSTFIGTFSPVDNPLLFDYPAEVFNINSVAQFVRIQITIATDPDFASMGEIAFATNDDIAIPEPSGLALFGLGATFVGWRRRGKKTAA